MLTPDPRLNYNPGETQQQYETRMGKVQGFTPTSAQATDKPATPSTPDQPTTPSIISQFKSPSGVVSSSPIRAAEQVQQADQIRQDQADQAELDRLTRKKQIQDIKASITPEGGTPAAPNLVDTYNGLRTSQGVTQIEDELAALRKKKLELQDNFNKFKANEPVGASQGFATARISEEAQKAQDELDRVSRDEQFATDRLNSRNKYIETVMSLTDKDYSNAFDQYNTEYTRNYNLQSMLQTDQNQQRDDSRAYLSTVANFIQNSGVSLDSLDPTMKAEIQKRELQAGFPAGTIETFVRAKPDARLLATKDGVDENGNATVSFIYADANGNPGIVRTVPLKGVRTSAKSDTGITTQQKAQMIGIADNELKQSVDPKTGFVNGADYLKLRSDWSAYDPNPRNFDEQFGYLLSDSDAVKYGIKK